MSVNVVCRLCLNLTENKFEAIDDVVLDVLLLKTDLKANENPGICYKCAESVQTALAFKQTCIETERHILSHAIGKNVAQFEMDDIFLTEVDMYICRFCIYHYKENDIVTVESLMKEQIVFNMFPLFMPEIDLSITRNPVICTFCKEELKNYFNFVETITKTQNEIKVVESKVDSKNSCIKEHTKEVYADTIESRELSDIIKNSKLKLTGVNPVDIILRMCPQKRPSFKNILRKRLNAEKMPSDTYYCATCPFKTKYKFSLANHMVLHRDPSTRMSLKCSYCRFETYHKKNLVEHMWRHRIEKRIYKCRRCARETDSKNDHFTHCKKHKTAEESSQEPDIVVHFKCSLCTFETNNEECLKNHVLEHQRVPTIKHIVTCECDSCVYKAKLKMRFQTLFRN